MWKKWTFGRPWFWLIFLSFGFFTSRSFFFNLRLGFLNLWTNWMIINWENHQIQLLWFICTILSSIYAGSIGESPKKRFFAVCQYKCSYAWGKGSQVAIDILWNQKRNINIHGTRDCVIINNVLKKYLGINLKKERRSRVKGWIKFEAISNQMPNQINKYTHKL